MAWPKGKDQPVAPSPGAVVIQARDISRAEIRLRCVEAALAMRSGASTHETIVGTAEKFFAWVVEETPAAK